MQRTTPQYLFSFQGRSGRLGYLGVGLSWIPIILVLALGTGLLGAISPPLAFLGVLVFIVVIPAFLVSYCAASVRRLHDLNLSGWWALLPIAVHLAAIPLQADVYDTMREVAQQAQATGQAMTLEDVPPPSAANASLFLMAQAVGILYALGLSLWPGKDETNAYGPPVPLKRG
jgi:uncharacterized membrane protein YhaH (DUF805 family)